MFAENVLCLLIILGLKNTQLKIILGPKRPILGRHILLPFSCFLSGSCPCWVVSTEAVGTYPKLSSSGLWQTNFAESCSEYHVELEKVDLLQKTSGRYKEWVKVGCGESEADWSSSWRRQNILEILNHTQITDLANASLQGWVLLRLHVYHYLCSIN